MCCRSDGINDGEAAGGDGREGGREGEETKSVLVLSWRLL